MAGFVIEKLVDGNGEKFGQWCHRRDVQHEPLG
jgi:hypothetical protein